MIATNYTNARQNFKEYCDIANNDFETIIVTRKSGGNVVIISEEEYNNIMENIFVRKNIDSYNELLESIEQIKEGKIVMKELIEIDL